MDLSGFRVATLHLLAPFLSAVPIIGSSRPRNVEAEFVFLVRSDLQNEVLSPQCSLWRCCWVWAVALVWW